MKEPTLILEYSVGPAESYPYFQAPSEWLHWVIGTKDPGCPRENNPDEIEYHDDAFRRWYAAFLLRERGL
jgi:hypothetical protein